jgi:hypothetical protein
MINNQDTPEIGCVTDPLATTDTSIQPNFKQLIN